MARCLRGRISKGLGGGGMSQVGGKVIQELRWAEAQRLHQLWVLRKAWQLEG